MTIFLNIRFGVESYKVGCCNSILVKTHTICYSIDITKGDADTIEKAGI